MKKIIVLVAALLCAGCGTPRYNEGGGHNLYGNAYNGNNRDYARNCGYAMDELLMCGAY
ncbi:hypothetical protein NKJ88_05840 [Mesorhizobium sp. M0016]|uniref:hypothetical protein n=1 Tax=Mesorhizobium sp. M0016 TaxID=2956843 RepID=UPI003337AB25